MVVEMPITLPENVLLELESILPDQEKGKMPPVPKFFTESLKDARIAKMQLEMAGKMEYDGRIKTFKEVSAMDPLPTSGAWRSGDEGDRIITYKISNKAFDNLEFFSRVVKVETDWGLRQEKKFDSLEHLISTFIREMAIQKILKEGLKSMDKEEEGFYKEEPKAEPPAQ